MNKIFDNIGTALAAAAACIGQLIGGFDGMLQALILFVVIDYITGVLVGIKKKALSSAIGANGLMKKGCIFLVVLLAYLVDHYALGGSATAFRTATILFYLANEGISVLENVAKLGVKLPAKLLKVLKQLQTEEEVSAKEVKELIEEENTELPGQETLTETKEEK